MTIDLKTRTLLRPGVLLRRYRNRLRIHAVQELFAAIGIATAVALVFATLVASQNVSTSANTVAKTLAGSANLQLRARSNEGFDERVLTRIERLPGVSQTAALLEQTATVVGPGRRRMTVDVIGAGFALARLDGLADTLPESLLSEGIGLSRPTADKLGITTASVSGKRSPGSVSLLLNGKASLLPISAVLTHSTGGAIAGALVAVMPLAHLQRLSGLPRRLSRVFIQTSPGREAAVRSELQRITQGRLTVASADQDASLIQQVLGPSNQANDFFAVVVGLLGFLFAFNAMLSTIPERRLEIADLRIDGTRNSAIVQMVLFQALCVGVLSSLAGLAGGYVLLTQIFHESPGYLSQAFVLGTSVNVWTAQPLLLSLVSGIVATCLASAVPLLDLRRGRSVAEVYFEDVAPGQGLGTRAQAHMLAAAACTLLLSACLFALARSAALLVCAMLGLATVLAVPCTLAGVIRIASTLAERYGKLTLLSVALTSLRATTIRSLALVATGAVALFGAIALGGSRENLLAGLHNFAHAYTSGAQLWIRDPGSTPDTTSFQTNGRLARISRIAGVEHVRVFHSEFLNDGNRRIVVLARPPSTSLELLRTQTIAGNPTSALGRLREGGWVTVSEQIAREQHAAPGGTVRLPTPTGIATLRLAATTTNLTWPGGAVLMSNANYERLWGAAAAGEIGVTLAPGIDMSRVRSQIASALGPGSSLETVTAQTWASRFDQSAGEGLSKLAWIVALLIAAAIFAMATALTSATWQQRTSLAAHRVEGAEPVRLRRLLLIETSLMLSAGCLTGAIGGILGQIAIDSYLKNVSGFPVAGITASLRPLEIFALVTITVLIFSWIPRLLASRVPPALALSSE